jgi:predicted permease
LAVREALGATRGRLIRQLIVESGVLGGAGLALGLALLTPAARVAARWLETYGGVTVPGGIGSVGLDGPVLAVIAGVVLLTFLPLAVWPALRASTSDARTPGRVTAGGGTVRLRRILATIQMAAAVTLLVQGGQLAQTVRDMLRTNLGFDPDNLLKAHLLLPRNAYPDAASRTAVMARILNRLRATPGVLASTSVFPHPFRGNGFSPVACEGCDDRAPVPAAPQTVTPDYFGLLGLTPLEGRLFQDQDDAEHEPVAVISRALARRLWPDASAIGRRLRSGPVEDDQPWLRVVGVVGEIRKSYSDSLYPDLYRPLAQAPRAYTALLVRTAGDPLSLERAIRTAVAEENPVLALSDVEPMTRVLADRQGRTRVLASFVGGVATLSFALTMVGLYAVVAYLVRVRRREFAIRSALGATPPQLGRQVLREARGMLGLGIVAGLAGAVAVSGAMRHQLSGLTGFDPAICVAVVLLVLLVALAALVLPARAAGRVDLSATLREQ